MSKVKQHMKEGRARRPVPGCLKKKAVRAAQALAQLVTYLLTIKSTECLNPFRRWRIICHSYFVDCPSALIIRHSTNGLIDSGHWPRKYWSVIPEIKSLTISAGW
jgi:hypothetical protein